MDVIQIWWAYRLRWNTTQFMRRYAVRSLYVAPPPFTESEMRALWGDR